MTDKSQFEPGHKIPVTDQGFPGKEGQMPNPKPLWDEIPTSDGGSQKYKAAGKLKGKKAIITGGDSEIWTSDGHFKRVQGYGQKCHLFPTDLRDRGNCRKVVDEALRVFDGQIDILFNNAAYQMMVEDIKDLSEDQWINTFDTNIHPFFYLSKYAIPHMKRGSTIINNASINAYVGRPDLLDYTSTKGAIVSFTRGLSNQQVGNGIRVNAVAPGPVWAPLIPSAMSEDAQKQFTSPMGRPAQPSEIATCVVFLASTDSSCVSGQVIHCNGSTIVNGPFLATGPLRREVPDEWKKFRVPAISLGALLFSSLITYVGYEMLVLLRSPITSGKLIGILYSAHIIYASFTIDYFFASFQGHSDVFFKGRLVDQQHTVSLLKIVSFTWNRDLSIVARERKIDVKDMPSLDHAARSTTIHSGFSRLGKNSRLWWQLSWVTATRPEIPITALLQTLVFQKTLEEYETSSPPQKTPEVDAEEGKKKKKQIQQSVIAHVKIGSERLAKFYSCSNDIATAVVRFVAASGFLITLLGP
ncbi:hypothetical protein OQA88_10353 [Cercophora sp. LCS_1]